MVLARITTNVKQLRYFAVQRHAANEISQLYPYPDCDRDNPDLCYWIAEPGSSSLEISVTNCGDFYVYFLQPTVSEPLKRETITPASVYCTSEETINRGNGCQKTFQKLCNNLIISYCYTSETVVYYRVTCCTFWPQPTNFFPKKICYIFP